MNAIALKATQDAVERLQAKVKRRKLELDLAVSAYANAEAELALALDRLERMKGEF